jgi:hypothetical protein
MALTRDFRETVQARVKSDPSFSDDLLSEALRSVLSGDVALGKELLRDCVDATVGVANILRSIQHRRRPRSSRRHRI